MDPSAYASLPLGPRIHTVMRQRPRREAWDRRENDAFSLWYVSEGGVLLDGERLSVPAGVLLQPDDGHRLQLGAGTLWWMIRFDLTTRPLRRLEQRGPIRSWHFTPRQPTDRRWMPEELWGRPWPCRIPAELLPRLQRTLTICSDLYRLGDTDWTRANLHLGLWLMDLVDHLRQPDVVTGIPDETFKAYIERLVRAHLDMGISVADLARLLGMSRQHLDRRLKAELGPGTKASDLIRRLRLERACHLLSATDHPIADVANLCGYRHPGSLSQDFKRLTGLSPSAWRRRQTA